MINKLKKLVFVMVVLLTLISISGCSRNIPNDESKFVIVTTLYPTYEFTNSILEGQLDVGKEIEVILN